MGRGLFAGVRPPLNPGNVNRYHYIGTLALTAAACLALAHPVGRMRWTHSRLATGALFTGWALVSVPLYHAAILSHDQTRAANYRANHARVTKWIDERVASEPEGADAYLPNIPFAIPLVTPQMFPRAAALFVLTDSDLRVAGRRVFFVEEDPSVLEAARAHPESKLMQILVAPDAVPESSRRARWR